MLTEVSIGEAFDKYNILELKLQKIVDSNRRANVEKEYNSLAIQCNPLKVKYDFLYSLLTWVNDRIWTLTDTIKAKTEYNDGYARIAKEIFDLNDKRFRIKNIINNSELSNLREQKSYSSNAIRLRVASEEIFFKSLSKINKLILDYDVISFECDESLLKTIRVIYNTSNFVNVSDRVSVDIESIDIESIDEPNESIFTFRPITYISGGFVGDFFHQLSIVYEKFRITGRKGILYISDKDLFFRTGLEQTYRDTEKVIKYQMYIHDYRIHKGEAYDINLSSWRANQPLNVDTWYDMFKREYNVEWSTHKYIDVPEVPMLNNVVCMSSSILRWNDNIDYNLLLSKYEKIIFIAFDEKEYTHFIEKTNIRLPFVKLNNFWELAVTVSSCKLFIGNLSSPLTIAQAVNKDRIGILIDGHEGRDKVHVYNLTKIWNNCKWIIKNSDMSV
jgi:hypothetical protein